MNSRQLQAVAYHEAGHAVFDFRQRLPIKWVSVVPKGDYAGRVKSGLRRRSVENLYSDNGTRHRLRIEALVRSALAGELAQRKHRNSSVRSWHGRKDREGAAVLLDEIVGSQRELDAYWRLLEIQTGMILDRPEVWHQVERLAAALVDKRRLTGPQVTSILREAFQEWLDRATKELREK